MKVKRKTKLSGSASRKQRRQRLAKAQAQGIVGAIVDMPYVGRLKTISDWHTQLARIYRRMLSGQIPEYVGTKLVYVATAGANLAKMRDELRETDSLRIAFERAVDGGLIARNVLPPAFGGEYIAKDDDPEDDDPMIHRKERHTNG